MPELDKLRRDVREFKKSLGEEPDFFNETRWATNIRLAAYKNPNDPRVLSKRLLGQRDFCLGDYGFESGIDGLLEMDRIISETLYSETQE